MVDGPNVFQFVLGDPINGVDLDGREVFAGSRDLDALVLNCLGDHGFIVVIPDEPAEFSSDKHPGPNLLSSWNHAAGSQRRGFTIGGHEVNGRLRIIINQTADWHSVSHAFHDVHGRGIEPSLTTGLSGHRPAFAHLDFSNLPSDFSDTAFINELLRLVKLYNRNEQILREHYDGVKMIYGERIAQHMQRSFDYSLFSKNCNNVSGSLIERAARAQDSSITVTVTLHAYLKPAPGWDDRLPDWMFWETLYYYDPRIQSGSGAVLESQWLM
jgi:hypothetical protein